MFLSNEYDVYHPEYDYDEYKTDSFIKEQAVDLLERALDFLYSKKDLDLCKLENTLDEFCYLLNIDPRPGDLTIRRL